MTDTSQPSARAELRAAVGAMIQRLRRDGAAPGIEIGEHAPDFTLPDAHGQPVALRDHLRAGPVVVSFYRGAWCPICNSELGELTAALPRITELGARLVAISPQGPDASQQLVQRLGLGFDVLSDVDQSTIRAYRLQFTLDDDLKRIYRDIGMALDEHNADASWDLPVPATFVLDAAGIVRARHVDPNYRERMPVDDIVAALEAIRQIVL
ncbi:MAG: peroxiredoxin-like family protein [Ilumatobacteraceae bacterium]